MCSIMEVLFVDIERKADDAMFKHNNVQRLLREAEYSLQQKTEEVSRLQQRYGSSHTTMVDLKLQITTFQEKVEKVIKLVSKIIKQI